MKKNPDFPLADFPDRPLADFRDFPSPEVSCIKVRCTLDKIRCTLRMRNSRGPHVSPGAKHLAPTQKTCPPKFYYCTDLYTTELPRSASRFCDLDSFVNESISQTSSVVTTFRQVGARQPRRRAPFLPHRCAPSEPNNLTRRCGLSRRSLDERRCCCARDLHDLLREAQVSHAGKVFRRERSGLSHFDDLHTTMYNETLPARSTLAV